MNIHAGKGKLKIHHLGANMGSCPSRSNLDVNLKSFKSWSAFPAKKVIFSTIKNNLQNCLTICYMVICPSTVLFS